MELKFHLKQLSAMDSNVHFGRFERLKRDQNLLPTGNSEKELTQRWLV
jgi:hypothetical protein